MKLLNDYLQVCILVAGPDFPTSMLCGILRMRIPQMLIGTTPVILVSIIPQVLVGALLTYQGAEADDDSSNATPFKLSFLFFSLFFISIIL